MTKKYEFAIKKDTLMSGKEIFTPVCRLKSPLGRLLNNRWIRITKTYDEYELKDLDFEPELSYEECKGHIEGYQAKLKELAANKVVTVEFDTLEDFVLTP